MTETAQLENVTLTVNRVINASLEKVWDTWTKPEEISKWWLPDGFTLPHPHKIDLQVEGEFEYHMQPPEGEKFYVRGTFKEIIIHSLIKSSWRWSGSDDETLLTVMFNETDSGTELKIVHEKFPDQEQKEKHLQGWMGMVDRMEKILK